MNKDYVSEFTLFMDNYLEQHPEVVEDQLRRCELGWHTDYADVVAQREAEEDRVPDDAYGFNWAVRNHKAHHKPHPSESH